MVDTHVHLMEPGDPTRENFLAGSSAAAASGVTTVVEHTHSWPVTTVRRLAEKRAVLSGRSHVDGEGKRNSDALPLSGSPIRTVLLGKNLFHATLYVLVALGAGTLAVLRMGRPSAVIVATTIGWLAFALPANLAAGNLLSLTMAYRVNLGRIGRQSGSQANALLSMVIQTMILGVGATVISLCGIFDEPWWAPPALFLLACASVVGWVLVLRHADRIAFQRRDALLAKLARIE